MTYEVPHKSAKGNGKNKIEAVLDRKAALVPLKGGPSFVFLKDDKTLKI